MTNSCGKPISVSRSGQRSRGIQRSGTEADPSCTKRIDDGSKLQADFDLARKTEKELSDQSAKLEKAWSDSSEAARKAKGALDLLEAARNGAQPSVETDALVQQMTQRLKVLNDTLSAARGTHSGDARTASGAFDTAIGNYKAEIERIKAATGDASPLAGYLQVAQQVEASVRQINADLADRQKTSQQTIADLNRKLAEKIEQHLKHTWDGDSNLQKNAQGLNVYQHQLGAVVTGAGLTDEVTRIRGIVDAYTKAVETRRAQLAVPAALSGGHQGDAAIDCRSDRANAWRSDSRRAAG